jgi:transcriptional regulator with XRE-family HTH domain
MEIGERLKEFYESKNYTQKAFADSVNLSKTTINNIVLGVSKPSFHIIENIALYHEDLDLRWLIIGVKKDESNVFEKTYDNSNFGIPELQEELAQYGRMQEVKVYLEKECSATGGRCYFDALKEANERIKELEEKYEKKK